MALNVNNLRAEHRSDALGLGVPSPRLSWIVAADAAFEPRAYEIRAHDPDSGTSEQSGVVQSSESVLVPWPFDPLSFARSSARHRQGRRRRRRAVGLERATRHRDRPARHDRLGRCPHHGPHRRSRGGETDPVPPQLLGPAGAHAGSAVRVGARCLHRCLQRIDDRRPRARPRLDGVPPPPALPDVRRHRSVAHRRQRVRGSSSPRAGTAAGSASGADGARSTAPTSDRSPSSSFATTTAASTPWRRIGSGGQPSTSGSRRVSTTARWPTPAWRSRGGRRPDSTTPRGSRCDELASVAATMIAPTGPPVRRIETLRPIAVDRSPRGTWVVDFGQNISGRVRITVRGAPGDRVTLRHAEVLEDGEPAMWLLRTAAATDTYVVAGRDAETYEPEFTIHGFRYVGIDGWPGDLDATAHRGGGLPLRHGADGVVPLLPRRPQPAPRQHPVEHARQLRRRAHRLPPARRAPRLDRRHPGVRAGRGLPVRLLRPAHVVVGRSRRRPAGVRHGAGVRAVGRAAVATDAGRGVGRRRRDRAVGAVRALRRRPGAGAPVRKHASVGRPDRRPGRRRPRVGARASSSAIGWIPPRHPAIREPGGPTRRWLPPPTTPTPRDCWPARPVSSDTRRTRSDTTSWPTQVRAGFNAEFVTATGRLASDAPTAYAPRAALRSLRLPVRSASAPPTAWPSWCGATTTASAPASSARRSSATPWSTPVSSDDAYHLLLQTQLPVVAVPGHDGCDDGVGAVGQPAAGRIDQPHGDDLVQPLRPRRDRRLPPPRRGRTGARRAGVSHAARPPLHRGWAHPCRGGVADAVRTHCSAVDANRRPPGGGRGRADREHRPGGAARQRRRRRRTRTTPLRSSAPSQQSSTHHGRRVPNHNWPTSTRALPDEPVAAEAWP